jgi:hypothetical protein
MDPQNSAQGEAYGDFFLFQVVTSAPVVLARRQISVGPGFSVREGHPWGHNYSLVVLMTNILESTGIHPLFNGFSKPHC